MEKNTHGFSLIEALVALLVVSIGLLGLGQLQARLWAGAGELHTAGTAFLLAGSLLEIAPVTWLPAPAKQAYAALFEPGLRAEIAHYPLPAASASLVSTRIDVHWSSPTGSASLSLGRALDAGLDPLDSRWLLGEN